MSSNGPGLQHGVFGTSIENDPNLHESNNGQVNKSSSHVVGVHGKTQLGGTMMINPLSNSGHTGRSRRVNTKENQLGPQQHSQGMSGMAHTGILNE